MPVQTLNENEQIALKQFKAQVRDLTDGMDPIATHDLNLLCWLRARDLNVEKAEEMFRNSMKWRKNNRIDNLADDHILNEHMVQNVPLRVGSLDRDGTMVICVPFGKWDLKSLNEQGYKDDILMHIFKLLECYFQFKQKDDFANKNMHTQCSIIFDFDQWSLKQAFSQHVVGWVMEFVRQFDSNYPERLKTAYLVNVPKVFEVLWAIVNPVLSKNTLNKIRILGGGPDKWRLKMKETIDPYQLPSELGGSNTTHYYVDNRFGISILTMPRSPLYELEDFVSVVVPCGEKYLRSFDLVVGNRITWNFRTDAYDIGFEFIHNRKPMFPYTKTDAHNCLQDGLVDVIEDGTYTLVFDNSYSRLRPKTLHFIICVDGKIVSRL